MKASLLLLLLLIAAPATADIRGTVTDSQGSPIPGAQVLLRTYGGGVGAAVVRTDAAGRFTADEGDAQTASLAAAATGYAPVAINVLDPNAQIVLRLPAPRAVTGHVCGPDGRPAPGVEVRLAGVEAMRQPGVRVTAAWVAGPAWGDLSDEVLPRIATHTDAAGAYRLEGLPPGRMVLLLRGPRLRTASFTVEDSPSDFWLLPGYRVHGRLTDGSAGVPGWRVHVFSETTTTGPDGDFEVTGLGPDECAVSADPPDGSGKVASEETVRLGPGRPDAKVVLKVAQGGILAGRVLDGAARKPLVNARVWVGTAEGASRTTLSDAEGRFVLALPAGTASISLPSAPAGLRRPAKVEAAIEAGKETRVEIALQPAPSLAGHVVDAQGKPVAGARVSARLPGWDFDWDGAGGAGLPGGPPSGGSAAAPSSQAMVAGWRGAGGLLTVTPVTTGPDGRFRIPDILEAQILVVARLGDEGTATPVTAKPPFPTDLRLTIGPLPRVVFLGRVVDERSRPLAGVPVRLRHFGGLGDLGGAEGGDETTTDGQGRYRFVVRDLVATYRTRVASDRCRPFGGGYAVGDQGAERHLSDLLVTQYPAAVAGRVLDARGQPAAGAVVSWPVGGRRSRTVTDAQGRFRIEGVPERTIMLAARAGRGVAFAPAAPGREVVLRLRE